jgi:hypothetical protein
MEPVSRREFGKKLLSSLLTYSLLKTAFEQELFAQTIKPTTDRWLKSIHELCGDLRTSKVSQVEWQAMIGRLHSRLEISEILRFLDFEKLEKQMTSPDAGVQSRVFRFPKLDWLPEAGQRGWGMSIFAVEKNSAVTPHGHYNMVSAHLVLKGSFRVRHFDRVEEESDHWIIKPTIDRVSAPGDETSISEKKDNIHWLQNIGDEKAFTLDVVVSGLDPNLDYSFKQTFLDPEGGERLKDGLIRAKKISYDEAVKLYRGA